MSAAIWNNLHYFDLSIALYPEEFPTLWAGGLSEEWKRQHQSVKLEEFHQVAKGFDLEGHPYSNRAGTPGRALGCQLVIEWSKELATLYSMSDEATKARLREADLQARIRWVKEYLEPTSAVTRVTDPDGTKRFVNGHGLYSLVFEPVGRANQLHFHWHVVIHNAVSVKDRGIYAHHNRPTFEHQTHLREAWYLVHRQELEKALGIELDKSRKIPRPIGVPDELVDPEKERSREIVRIAKARGHNTQAGRRFVNLATRRAKRDDTRKLLKEAQERVKDRARRMGIKQVIAKKMDKARKAIKLGMAHVVVLSTINQEVKQRGMFTKQSLKLAVDFRLHFGNWHDSKGYTRLTMSRMFKEEHPRLVKLWGSNYTTRKGLKLRRQVQEISRRMAHAGYKESISKASAILHSSPQLTESVFNCRQKASFHLHNLKGKHSDFLIGLNETYTAQGKRVIGIAATEKQARILSGKSAIRTMTPDELINTCRRKSMGEAFHAARKVDMGWSFNLDKFARVMDQVSKGRPMAAKDHVFLVHNPDIISPAKLLPILKEASWHGAKVIEIRGPESPEFSRYQERNKTKGKSRNQDRERE